MALITAKFNAFKGESTVSGYAQQVEAIGLRETIHVAPSAMAGATGKSEHSDIQLIRYKDTASPKFMEYCLGGMPIGDVEINVFRTIATGAVPFMTYKLTGTYVSRVEQETLDEQHNALGPHLVEQTRGLPTAGALGLTSVLAPAVTATMANGHLNVVPIDVTDSYTEREIERVYLNPMTVAWTYTPYVGSQKQPVVEGGWDLFKREVMAPS